MDRAGTTFGLILAAALAVGCTSSQSETPTTSVKAPPDIAGAKVAVQDFLEAVRTGDDMKAASMLTPLARQKTSERDLVVAPPGSPQASFKVGQVEKVTDGVEVGAHVETEWTDVDGEGNRHSDTILWVLRAEPEGWRIAGMITKIFPELEPIVLNFEDPDDMVRKQQLAQEEFERRAQAEAAAQGQAPGQGQIQVQGQVPAQGQAAPAVGAPLTSNPPVQVGTVPPGQVQQEQTTEAKTPVPVNRLR